MKKLVAMLVAMGTLGFGSVAFAGLLPPLPPLPALPALPEIPNACGTSEASGCWDPETNPASEVICHCPPTAAELERIRQIDGCATVDQVICISNFQYNPPVTTAVAGAGGIAWVNVEQCPSNDLAAEALVAGVLGVGCDTHHEVLTFPDIPGATGDALVFEDVCSPYPGCAATTPLGIFPIAAESCDEADSNVRCHVFEQPGLQHYTCETNPAHTLLLNGLLLIQP